MRRDVKQSQLVQVLHASADGVSFLFFSLYASCPAPYREVDLALLLTSKGDRTVGGQELLDARPGNTGQISQLQSAPPCTARHRSQEGSKPDHDC